jgi:hypothetical protein
MSGQGTEKEGAAVLAPPAGAGALGADGAAAPRPWAARAPIVALYAANAISLVGSMLTAVAIPWFVLVTTGSAAKTGLTVFFTTLPLFLSGFFGGALVGGGRLLRRGARRA